MTEKIILTHSKMDSMVIDICNRVHICGIPFKSVVGIQRGGLHLSLPLADCLKVKHRSIKVSWYDDDKKRKEPLVDLFDLDLTEKPFLLVDDLIDSGGTIKYLIEKYNLKQGEDFYMAVLFNKKNNEAGLVPDFYCEDKPEGWLCFPWETE